jgi:hypothetical protein
MKTFAAVAAMLAFAAIGALAETTNTLPGAEVQGRQLVQKILAQRPGESFTNTGVLKIRGPKGARSEIQIEYQTAATPTNWQSIYVARWTNSVENLSVIHTFDLPNTYAHNVFPKIGDIPVSGLFRGPHEFSDLEKMASFAGSDFAIGDLGLEFLHWPEQKILKHEVRSSRGCTVLESTNPDPSTNGYSRVVSWIDTEALGIVEADAYDFKGKQLKIFTPKDFKKVDGHWQVQTFLMENVQTGSRSRLEFDLKK